MLARCYMNKVEKIMHYDKIGAMLIRKIMVEQDQEITEALFHLYGSNMKKIQDLLEEL